MLGMGTCNIEFSSLIYPSRQYLAAAFFGGVLWKELQYMNSVWELPSIANINLNRVNVFLMNQ